MTTPPPLGPIAAKVAEYLAKAGIAFYPVADGRLRVPLPGGFGEFEIGALESDRVDSILGLVDDAWHTHGDLLGDSSFEGQCAALFNFVCAVFDGDVLLIEERTPGEAPRRWVEDDLDSFKRNLTEGATYKIFNAK